MKTAPDSSNIARKSRLGFTLVEVLVSSALTLVIMSMLFTILIGAMDAWRTGTGRLQGNADARMALDIIASDLESMVVRQTSYTQEWLVSVPLATPGDPSGRSATQLLFFAPSLDRDPGQEGDIVAINYRLGFQDPLAPATNAAMRRIYGLYKTMASTEDTFRFALGQTDIRAGFWDARNPTDASPPPPDLLIPNVVDFQVVWHVELPDSTTAFENGVILRNQLFRASDPSNPGGRILFADISLTILNEEGATRVQTFARAGGLPAQMPNIIREFGRVYTKRVEISY